MLVKSRKITILVLAVFLFTSMAGIGVAPVLAAANLTDINDNWAYSQIVYLLDKGLVAGYADGTFQPNSPISRAEFMTLTNRDFGYNNSVAIDYTDVKSGDWFYNEVAKAKAAGYIAGYPDGSMLPDGQISRQEVAVIMAQVLKLDTSSTSDLTFSDAASIAAWSRNAIAAMVRAGYISGYPDGTFRPLISISRAEAAVIMRLSLGNQVGQGPVAAQPSAATPALTPTATPAPTQGLTIEQALDRALAHSNILKQDALTIENSKAVYDVASTNNLYVPTGPTPDAAISAFTGLISASINWNMAKRSETVAEDKLDLAVFSAYTNVLNAAGSLAYARQTLSNAQTQWNNALIGYQVGINSSYQQDAADTQIKTMQNNLQSAQLAYDKAYQALNNLMGVAPETRDVLAEQPAYQPFDILSIEDEANKAASSDPVIYQLQQATYLAQVNLNLYNWSSASKQPYTVAENNVSNAELNLSTAEDQLRQQVRDLYSSILSSEAAYNTQLAALNQAKETLAVKQLYFNLGMAISADVQAAALDLANCEKNLSTTIYQHEYSKLAFQKPWAM